MVIKRIPKLLNVSLFNDYEPNYSMRKAMQDISNIYSEYQYDKIKPQLNTFLSDKDYYDVIFLQMQEQNVKPEVLKSLTDKGVLVFNFSGDVRQPIPKWYVDIAPYCITLLTNLTDVEYLNSLGYKAHYFQVGYNEHFYNATIPYRNKSGVVFLGNNYNNHFHLSKFRFEMVDRLKEEFGELFTLYGNGWKNAKDLNYQQQKECEVYNQSKIAINLSHFDLKRYSSDRMYRIMACETLCLSHKFKEIENEFADGIHLRWWESLDELASLVRYYLNEDNEIERRDIARAGRIYVQRNYTWDYRFTNQFLKIVEHEKRTLVQGA